MKITDIKKLSCEITADDARKLLGFNEETGEYTKNFPNRPYRPVLAKRYKLEILRKKWRLNGENISFDKNEDVVSGQHRLRGLILAEEYRTENKTQCKERYGWSGPIKIEVVLVNGISNKADVIDTVDIGQSRSAGDVLFRRKEFSTKKYDAKQVKRLTTMLSHATRLVWLRNGGKIISDAPHFPHSEMLDFLKLHPLLTKAVEFIYAIDEGESEKGKEKNVQAAGLPVGQAAALLYLFAFSDGSTKGDRWAKAEAFFSDFSSGEDLTKGDAVYELRAAYLRAMNAGTRSRDDTIGMAVNAWNLYVAGKKAAAKTIKVAFTRDRATSKRIMDVPRCGGLDVQVVKPEEVVEEEETVEA